MKRKEAQNRRRPPVRRLLLLRRISEADWYHFIIGTGRAVPEVAK